MKKSGLIVILTFCFVIAASSQNFNWAKQLGGYGGDAGTSIATDLSDNVYITGTFIGNADFDPGSQTLFLNSQGLFDIFVCKLNDIGELEWAKSFGGPAVDWSSSIFVDESGNVCTTGDFQGTVDFDPGDGIFNLTSNGERDIFIGKLDSLGNFLWAKSLGGSEGDAGRAVAVDNSGNVHVTGYFRSTVDFNPGEEIYNLTSVGDIDSFVLKLDSSGNFIWAKQMGGLETENGESIEVDDQGNVYSQGIFSGTSDFDPGEETYNLIPEGTGFNIYISKLDPLGNFIWAKSNAGATINPDRNFSLDHLGNLYTTGTFSGSVDFDPGEETHELTSSGQSDAFICKWDTSGSFLWAKQIGATPTSFVQASAIVANADGVYSSGILSGSADFDPGPDSHNITFAGVTDAYVHKLNADGDFQWVEQLGGDELDGGESIAISTSNAVYSTGYFSGTANFNFGDETQFNLSSSGLFDVYVHKLSQFEVDIAENNLSHNLLVYPNPTNNYLTIDLGKKYENIFLTIRNSAGQLVTVERFPTSQFLQVQILGNAGMYFLEIRTGKGQFAHYKVLKQ